MTTIGRHIPHLVLLAGVLTVVALPREAEGVSRGEWAVGLSPTYAFIVLNDKAEPDGGGATVHVQLGVSDAIALRLSGLWTAHGVEPSDDNEGGLYHVANLALGLQYAFDLVAFTPSIEVGAGVLYLHYRGDSAVNLGLHAGVAVDYWVLDWLALGAAFHYHAFISNPNNYPVYFDAGPRVAVRWR